MQYIVIPINKDGLEVAGGVHLTLKDAIAEAKEIASEEAILHNYERVDVWEAENYEPQYQFDPVWSWIAEFNKQ